MLIIRVDGPYFLAKVKVGFGLVKVNTTQVPLAPFKQCSLVILVPGESLLCTALNSFVHILYFMLKNLPIVFMDLLWSLFYLAQECVGHFLRHPIQLWIDRNKVPLCT